MGKYRKKPMEIEAWQWNFSDDQEPPPSWMKDAFGRGLNMGGATFQPEHEDGPRICIATLEGTMVARAGDWIIQGVKGELYPCKPDIFKATYEPVEDGDE